MSDKVQYFNMIKKYLLDEFQYLKLFDFLKDKIIIDIYVCYTTCNLYYNPLFLWKFLIIIIKYWFISPKNI